MTDIDISRQAEMGGVVCNAFGEHYLFGINRNLFQGTDASTVFRSYFGESLFKEDTFYIIAGTDSGLLFQYVKAKGLPKGSRYLFVELPQVLGLLEAPDTPQAELAITTSENWQTRAEEMELQKFALLGRLVLLRSLGVVHGHCSAYPPFWRKLKGEFDAFVENIYILIKIRPFIICQIENLTENQIPAICLKETFRGKTAVVLAGGPSLDELLPWVQQHRNNLLVIAVSRISRSLLKAGIQPDISVSVDPLAMNLNVCSDILQFQDGTLLANNYHLSPNLLASWGGQKVFIGPRYPWSTPLQPENFPNCGGTTVTNTALDLAVKLGAAQVILGGADFCFGQQGHTHASGTVEHAKGSMPQRCELQVETNSGMMADTANGYVESGKHFDSQVRKAVTEGCRVINPAPGAMRLPNVEHLSLDAIPIEPMDMPARDVLATCVPSSDSHTRTRLYKEELSEVDRVLRELVSVRELSSKALAYNTKVIRETGRGDTSQPEPKNIDPAIAKKIDHIDAQLSAKYAETMTFIKRYGVARFLPNLGLDIEQVDELVKNSDIYFKAVLETSDELIAILRKARVRILSRLEEEKPQPNVTRLIEQWHQDQQPGRAIQWARLNASVVSQLPETQQRALRAFQDTFEQSLEELGRDYAKLIERDSELNRIASRAKEYFLCRDKAGLLRLLGALRTHHDQQQAGHFSPLVEGYLAELDNESALAIDSYQKIVDGAAHIDALMRLFELHVRNEDWHDALSVLKTLSGISSTFTPMYADLLQSAGDVDAAIEIYTDYLLANPDDLNTMMKLGHLFRLCESEDGVEWTMSYILGKDPGNQTAQQMLNEMRSSMEAASE